MNYNIPVYPVLNDQKRSRLRFNILKDYEFHYIRNDENFPLYPEELGNGVLNHKLVDNKGIWNPDTDNLIISRTYSFQNYEWLFGKEGIVCSNATIGLAVVWTSADSKQRGAIEVGELKKSSDSKMFRLYYEFAKAQLRGLVEFDTVFYVKHAGTPSQDELYLANGYGMRLGNLDRFQIQLDGNGSVFPIYEVNEPGQPLWYVKCSWEDPTYDLFTECVSVNLNKAHKNYKYLDKSLKTYDPQLLIEIMANAMEIVISKLRIENVFWQNTLNGTDLQRGSVSEAVNYFVTVLGWDVTSPETASISIRKFFDKKDIE